MKTPDEIKKALECCQRMTGCGKCPYLGSKCALEVSADTLEYIKQLEQINADFAERVAQLEAKNGDWVAKCHMLEEQSGKDMNVPSWISVEERLPSGSNGFDFCVTVIVYTQDEQVTTGWNNNGAWYLLNWDNDFISKHPAEYVTHWMPLPEPPKEDAHGI